MKRAEIALPKFPKRGDICSYVFWVIIGVFFCIKSHDFQSSCYRESESQVTKHIYLHTYVITVKTQII